MKPDYEAQIKAGAIILAGGDGTRLVSMTRKTVGRDLPKQFCPILGEETLLEQTMRRVSLSISTERPVSVLSRAHEHFYSLTAIQPDQPENRSRDTLWPVAAEPFATHQHSGDFLFRSQPKRRYHSMVYLR